MLNTCLIKDTDSALTVKAVDEIPNVACLASRDVNDGKAVAFLVLGTWLEDHMLIGYGPEHRWVWIV